MSAQQIELLTRLARMDAAKPDPRRSTHAAIAAMQAGAGAELVARQHAVRMVLKERLSRPRVNQCRQAAEAAKMTPWSTDASPTEAGVRVTVMLSLDPGPVREFRPVLHVELDEAHAAEPVGMIGLARHQRGRKFRGEMA